MSLHLLLGLLLVGAIAPSLAAPNSQLRPLRFVFVLAVYPLFVAMGLSHRVEYAVLLWLGLAGLTLLLDLAADRLLSPKDRSSLLNTVWRAALLWPLLLPAALEALLIHVGLAPATPPAILLEPPRGDELFTLSDDELLVAGHQILAGESKLTDAETTLWLAETFSRETHGGGLSQWFSNADSSVPDTMQALRAVGAGETAGILLRASEASSSIPALDEELFSEESRENLTTLNARFIRENRSRFPSLNGKRRQEP